MSTELKRVTFVITPELEAPLDSIKKELFYNKTKSDMIRELVLAGMRALDEKNKENNDVIDGVS